MTKKIFLLIVLIVLILLVGCENEPDTRSAKEKAQDALLDELADCNTAFGMNDGENKRIRNKEYCIYVMDIVDGLIRDGYFDGINVSLERSPRAPQEMEEYEEVNKLKSEIIGDI